MAEKEERILVLTTHNEDGECECVTQDGCHANDSCAICNVGMTLAEAVDKMAKAIYDEEIVRCNEVMCAGKECKDCFRWKKCEKVAEAALNALLEDE